MPPVADPSTHQVSSAPSWRTNTVVAGPSARGRTSTSPERASPCMGSPTTGSVKPTKSTANARWRRRGRRSAATRARRGRRRSRCRRAPGPQSWGRRRVGGGGLGGDRRRGRGGLGDRVVLVVALPHEHRDQGGDHRHRQHQGHDQRGRAVGWLACRPGERPGPDSPERWARREAGPGRWRGLAHRTPGLWSGSRAGGARRDLIVITGARSDGADRPWSPRRSRRRTDDPDVRLLSSSGGWRVVGEEQRKAPAPRHEEEAMALMRRERFDLLTCSRSGSRALPAVRHVVGHGRLDARRAVHRGRHARRRAELPDIDPDKDLELTVADGMLHIRRHAGEPRPGRRSSTAASSATGPSS